MKEHVTIFGTAKEGESSTTTHSRRKTSFVKNGVGEMVSIATSAIYVKRFNQDLMAGKSLNQEKICIIRFVVSTFRSKYRHNPNKFINMTIDHAVGV